MSKGIVRITPRNNSKGKLSITLADSNPYGVVVGSELSFSDPGFTVNVGDGVNCIINSASTCTVTR